MKFKGLNAPVMEPMEKNKAKREQHRLFMKKEKQRTMFGRKMKMVQDGR